MRYASGLAAELNFKTPFAFMMTKHQQEMAVVALYYTLVGGNVVWRTLLACPATIAPQHFLE